MERNQLIELVNGLEKVSSIIEVSRETIKELLKDTSAHGPAREQVEKWKGEWIVKHDGFNEITITECSKCEDETIYEFFFEDGGSNFCPHCGSPMTDEAVENMIERLSGIK